MTLRSTIYRDPDMVDSDDDDDELGVVSSGSDDEAGVDSPCKRPPMDEMLPARRGISKFYNGKSKSFTSLSDAVSSASVKELAKPETVYSKKQISSSGSHSGGPLKKHIPIMYGNRSSIDASCSTSVSPPVCLPPLHPQSKKIQNAGSSVSPPRQKCSPWRSFSVSDLQGMVRNA